MNQASVNSKIYHFAAQVSNKGDVRPLCRVDHKRPRKVNLAVECWTNRTEAVDCPRCLKRIKTLAAWPLATNVPDATAAPPVPQFKEPATESGLHLLPLLLKGATS